MDGKKVKSAILRTKGRKYPIISFIFDDNSEKAMTVKADLKTAQKLLLKIKREIALGTFNLDDYTSIVINVGITLNDFYNKFLAYREKLVKIEIFPGNHDGNLKKLIPKNIVHHPSKGAAILNGAKKIGLLHGHTWPAYD